LEEERRIQSEGEKYAAERFEQIYFGPNSYKKYGPIMFTEKQKNAIFKELIEEYRDLDKKRQKERGRQYNKREYLKKLERNYNEKKKKERELKEQSNCTIF
jgi:hypothetical protein